MIWLEGILGFQASEFILLTDLIWLLYQS